jgi:peptidyl-prolyl cis-trans isomerase C
MTDRIVSASRKTPAALTAALFMGVALAAAPLSAHAQDAAPAEAPAATTEAPAAAPAEVTPDTVVATVGDEAITEADLAFAAEDLQQELGQMPPQDRRAFLVTVLIDMKVMANAAREREMDQSEIFQRRQKYLEERALRRAFFAEEIAAGVTPEAVQAAYDELIANFEPQEEVHARHVLVATEESAEAVKAEIEAGRPFEEVAMEKSTDPSAQQNGGDLGFFSRGMMVKPFEDAAFAMEAGEVSDPIQSDFGWHVIRVEEKRQSQPPAMEEVSQQLQQQVMFQTFEATVTELKAATTIDIPDATLAEGVARQQAGQQPAPQQPAQ